MVTLGSKKLAQAVKRRGLSERQAAALVGCGFSSMHRYLTGERAPTGAILFRLEREFGVEASEFFVSPRSSKPAA